MAKDVSRLSKLVSKKIEDLKGIKTQKEIAEEVGFKSVNMITMLKTGEAKLAIERAVSLAKALEADPRQMLIMAMERFYEPATVREIVAVLSDVVTENELKLLLALREANGNTDPKFSDEKIEAIKAAAI